MICVGEILELESEDLCLIPDSCHIAAMRIWASHFPSRNFGFFICKWVYSATQLTHWKTTVLPGNHTEIVGIIIIQLNRALNGGRSQDLFMAKTDTQFLQWFSESPFWVSKNWHSAFLTRDQILKYYTDIVLNFSYFLIRCMHLCPTLVVSDSLQTYEP